MRQYFVKWTYFAVKYKFKLLIAHILLKKNQITETFKS